MTDRIADGVIARATAAVHNATTAMEAMRVEATAMRAATVQALVHAAGSQAAAARALGLDQSTINKMLRRPDPAPADLAWDLARPFQLRLPDTSHNLRAEAAVVTDDDASQAERTEAAHSAHTTLIGIGKALAMLADHATAEADRIAAEFDTAEAADPSLVEDPTAEMLSRDAVRIALTDLVQALHKAADDAHLRAHRAGEAAEPDLN